MVSLGEAPLNVLTKVDPDNSVRSGSIMIRLLDDADPPITYTLKACTRWCFICRAYRDSLPWKLYQFLKFLLVFIHTIR